MHVPSAWYYTLKVINNGVNDQINSTTYYNSDLYWDWPANYCQNNMFIDLTRIWNISLDFFATSKIMEAWYNCKYHRNKHTLNIFGTWQITDEIFFNIKKSMNLNYLIIRVNRIFHNMILWLLAINSPYTYYVHRFTMMLMNSGTRQICTKIQKRDIQKERER